MTFIAPIRGRRRFLDLHYEGMGVYSSDTCFTKACGAPTPTYTIGGSLTGLMTGTSAVLENGADSVRRSCRTNCDGYS
jgi:hypothetical protein